LIKGSKKITGVSAHGDIRVRCDLVLVIEFFNKWKFQR